MADILIRGMKMPTGCLHCFLFSGQGCKATNKLFPDWLNVATRPTGCPLVEIPPHGRLIDADAVSNRLRKLMQSSDMANNQWFINTLREMPTIIPASEV